MKADKMRAVAQLAAEDLHEDTGAMFTVTIAADFPHGDLVIGAWCPNTDVVVALLEKVAERLRAGDAVIVDKTRGGAAIVTDGRKS